jgi:hypothetical protein
MDIERDKPGTAADKTVTSQSISLRLNRLYEINKQSSARLHGKTVLAKCSSGDQAPDIRSSLFPLAHHVFDCGLQVLIGR